MTIRDILKMGDPRLLRIAQTVTQFDTDALHFLISDLLETMHAADGAGLAAPLPGFAAPFRAPAPASPPASAAAFGPYPRASARLRTTFAGDLPDWIASRATIICSL